MQLTHYTNIFTPKTFPIIVICENVTNAPNIGSLFRIADAFGIEKLIFCTQVNPLGRKMTKTSRSTEKVVPYEVIQDCLATIHTYKNKGFNIVALEITNDSIPIQTAAFSKKTPVILVIGDENFGISEDVLKLADTTVHINMYGKNSSMNVVQATNIALYEMTKQML